ncbi:MAG: hypothetical protein IT423_18440 [Pirellulaceae bacterium]|nr:hypothetical protein [Pirellulaceae bacterium]
MVRSSPRRGLQIMRTQSTRKAVGSLNSPEMYIRLTSLEMERSRREMERNRLLDRVRILDERITKIVEEQSEMRQRIEVLSGNRPVDAPVLPKDGSNGGFGFTY